MGYFKTVDRMLGNREPGIGNRESGASSLFLISGTGNRELVPCSLFGYVIPMFQKCKSGNKEPVPGSCGIYQNCGSGTGNL